MFTFELICLLLEGYLKFFTLSVFFGVFKIIKILNFQHTLSRRRQIVSAGSACVNSFPVLSGFFSACLRRQFFSADSACVGKLLAQAQPAQAFLAHTQHAQRPQIFFSAYSAKFQSSPETAQAPVVQTPSKIKGVYPQFLVQISTPGAAHSFVVQTSPGAAPAPCGVDTSMCSRGFCSIDKSRCS